MGNIRQKKGIRTKLVPGSDYRETITSPLQAEGRNFVQNIDCQNLTLLDQAEDEKPSKPPLKPSSHRKYYTKSVCTKSTASATYVSSDSEEDSEEVAAYTFGDDVSYFDSQESSLIPPSKDSGETMDNVHTCTSVRRKSFKKASNGHFDSHAEEFKVRQKLSVKDRGLYCGSDEENSVFNLTSEDSCEFPWSDDEDSSVTDLDMLISQASERWKSEVVSVVAKTTTAAFTKDLVTVPSALDRCKNIVAIDTAINRRPSMVRSCTLPTESGTASSMISAKASPAPTERLIEDQKAEIERLRGMLRDNVPGIANQRFAESLRDVARSTRQISTCSSVKGPRVDFTRSLSLPAVTFVTHNSANQRGTEINAFNDLRNSLNLVPVEHIEVRMRNDEHDDFGSASGLQDDLTVGSSFGAFQERRSNDEECYSAGLVSNSEFP